jgi:haloalkane dehalogenase
LLNKKILFTSVCRPLGPDYGDAPSVGYELLHRQVTRAQGLFSPRALHLHFSLDYIAQNLDTPAVVLQYPSKSELIRELRKGYDYVGVSFLLAVFHRMKDVVALIREHSPSSKIILGGYGTVLSDDVLKPYADYICREEGVAFIRNLLGEPELPMPYQHPLLVSRLKVFSKEISKTGMVFAGLGCPNGCDFCCTSYFFKRRHIRLLPTGKDIFDVVERYLKIDPRMSLVVLDEDFLLNKKRAMEFRECVKASGRTFSMFVFSSIRAISQYTVEEILEMGIDGFWIGYEGTRSGFGKQKGRPAEEIFREFREHGITILASMIVGFPYQTPEIIEEELSGLMRAKPTLGQFLIYGPTPGTPFYERIMNEGLLHQDLADNREKYYRSCDGFKAMVKHPTLSAEEIEKFQRYCFEQDFQRLGPSIYRFLETYLLGYRTMKTSANPALRAKAEWLAQEIRKAYPVFLAGSLFGPNRAIRKWISDLEVRAHAELDAPTTKPASFIDG